MAKKGQIKIDRACEHFKFHHCLATQSPAGCKIVQFCDMGADYCVKKNLDKSKQV